MLEGREDAWVVVVVVVVGRGILDVDGVGWVDSRVGVVGYGGGAEEGVVVDLVADFAGEGEEGEGVGRDGGGVG